MSKNTNQGIGFTVFAAMLGHAFESYDFYVYAFLTTVIAELFFPSTHPYLSLISAMGVFAAGYLIRPLGGVFFGYLADKHGRQKVFVATMLLLVVVTVVMGLLPVYAQIGWWAAVFMSTLRLLQGFAFGGEFTSALVYVNEFAPDGKESTYGSWFMVAMALGYLSASFVTAMTAYLCSEEVFKQWGWRIPFLIGGFTGFIALCCRIYLTETADFEALRQSGKVAENPLKETLTTAKKQMAYFMGLSVLGTMDRVIFFAYIPIFLNTVGGLPLSKATFISVISILVFIPFSILWGKLADHYGKRFFLILGSLCVVISAPLLFYLAAQQNVWLSLTATSVYAILLSMYTAPSILIVRDLFPSHIRSTSQSLGWNIVNSVLGGTSLIVATLLIELTGSSAAPGFYVAAGALVSFIAALAYKEYA